MNGTTEHPIFYWHDSPGNRFRVDVADFDEAAECAYCVPVYSAETVDRLRARVAELEAEVLAEREACAKVCETEALRRTTSLAAMGAKECATAIRAMAKPSDGCECPCSDIQAAHGHHTGCPAKGGA